MTDKTTPSRKTSTSSGPRRRSKLTSGGKWDWAYDQRGPLLSRDDQDSSDPSNRLSFPVVKLPRKSKRTLWISIPDRSIRITNKLGESLQFFPTAAVSRLTPQGDRIIEVRAGWVVRASQRSLLGRMFGRKHSSWVRTFQFEHAHDRDDFLNIVRGLNAVGGMVSNSFQHIRDAATPENLVKSLRTEDDEVNYDRDPYYEPPVPSVPLDETSFFKWFLLVSEEKDAQLLLKQIEDFLANEKPSASKATHDLLSKASSGTLSENKFSKRAPLLAEPKLVNDETIIIIEDTVTLIALLDANQSRHLIGEFLVTNYRLAFSVYQSEMTLRKTSDVPVLNGVQGMAGYSSLAEMSPFSTTAEALPSMLFGYVDMSASVKSSMVGRRPDAVHVAVNIPLSSVRSVEVKKSKLIVGTTLGRVYQFQFDRQDDFLQTLAERTKEALGKSFASSFLDSVNNPVAAPPTPLVVYDAKAELARQTSSSKFGIFNNSGFDLCSTYPSMLVFPKDFLSHDKLSPVSRFRSRHRVPAITWVHRSNEVVLVRSSQPHTGLKQQKCIQDEELLRAMTLSSQPRFFIVDARGPAAVAGNQLARGKGAELPSRYPDATFLFMGIGNIHTMRGSQERLAMACTPGGIALGSEFAQRVESSGWLQHVHLVLEASARVAEVLELQKCSVLVHCSDGWDRTAQITSLAQIILDPFYRTIRGLGVLVEKDWVGFGFKFQERCVGKEASENSPIWIQFIDCLYQLHRQFPKHFEYNESMLLALADAPYTGRFATFAFDSECARSESCRGDKAWRATEFWAAVFATPAGVLNQPDFEPYSFGPLWPKSTSSRRIVLWEALHMRADASVNVQKF